MNIKFIFIFIFIVLCIINLCSTFFSLDGQFNILCSIISSSIYACTGLIINEIKKVNK